MFKKKKKIQKRPNLLKSKKICQKDKNISNGWKKKKTKRKFRKVEFKKKLNDNEIRNL